MRGQIVLLFSVFIASQSYGNGGNGAPSGGHYSLNIIGSSKVKNVDGLKPEYHGHVIFMPLNGSANISLVEGSEVRVLDPNGTDGSAKLQLPNPDADGDGIFDYDIYVRSLGKPGGSAQTTTCMDEFDVATGTTTEICSVESTTWLRKKGKSTFVIDTQALLSIIADLDGNGVVTEAERVNIFDENYINYRWEDANSGLRLRQLRFVPKAK